MIEKKRLKGFCDRAIAVILREGTTDVELFNKPFEVDLLKNNDVRTDIKTRVYTSIVEATEKSMFDKLRVHKLGYVLVPKKSLSDFRKCAWIDVYDEIIYLTLVLAMASSIEKSRVHKSKNRVFSYRYMSSGKNLFDPEYNYTKFIKEVERKSNFGKNKILVECDISNYYDRVNLHRIESVLRSIPEIDTDLIKLLNELLLYWADRDSYGLPVGSNASRILAEAALTEVDNYLTSKNVDFCRFVDDYRIFAKDAFEAHSNLAILNRRLSQEGLFLNNQKTNIRDISFKRINRRDSEEKNGKQDANKEEAPDLSKVDLLVDDDLEIPKIIRGYSGLIPTKFRKLSLSEINNLKKNDLDSFLDSAKKTILIQPKELTILVRTIVAQERYRELAELPSILRKFPQFIPYFVDVLLKHAGFLEENDVISVQEDFQEWMNSQDTPEYIQVYLIRLYASTPFQSKTILLNTFRNLKRNSGDYVGRALLEALEGLLTRGELLEIRDYYYRADRWEARQILKLINHGLSEGEKRPFFKDVRIHEDEIFINKIIEKK